MTLTPKEYEAMRRDAERYRWILRTLTPQIMQNPFHDTLTLVISKGVELPFPCKAADEVTDVGQAIDAAINAEYVRGVAASDRSSDEHV
ncbi:MAG TPA: hypothetical protein VFU31_24750 [Candidatus Binatia bacterium]|nr:hypothetical protein [Candidatus Binatia bacterium]